MYKVGDKVIFIKRYDDGIDCVFEIGEKGYCVPDLDNEDYDGPEIIVKEDRENLRLNFDIFDSEPEKDLGLTFQSVILKSFKDNERNSPKKQRESQSAKRNYLLDYAYELDGKTK